MVCCLVGSLGFLLNRGCCPGVVGLGTCLGAQVFPYRFRFVRFTLNPKPETDVGLRGLRFRVLGTRP